MSDPGFRALPAVHALLELPELADLLRQHGKLRLLHWTRRIVEDARQRLAEGSLCGTRAELQAWIVQQLHAQAAACRTRSLMHVINATGVVLHTSLGRAPLSPAATEALVAAATQCNLEVDLVTGERRPRGYQIEEALQLLTGSEAGLVVNNNAAATLLALRGLCAGREVLVSRGQLIEIGGSFRLPEIFAESGAVLREVGTTNRTHLADYAQGLSDRTVAILHVHPSNYHVAGFAGTPPIRDLVPLARQHGLLCLDDIGSGSLIDTRSLGLPAEPCFHDSLLAGADLVLGSGDKLLGGPQCGLLVGRGDLIRRLQSHPLARALRVDKLTLAALAATLDSYLHERQLVELPLWQMLGQTEATLIARAQTIVATALTATAASQTEAHATPTVSTLSAPDSTTPSPVPMIPSSAAAVPFADVTVGQPYDLGLLTCTVLVDTALVGGGALPTARLPTAILRLTHAHFTPAALAKQLRLQSPPIFPRIEHDAVLLDLRSVLPQDDSHLVTILLMG